MQTTNITLETPSETRERCKAHGAEWLGDRMSFKQSGSSFRRSLVRAVFEAHGFGMHLPAEPKPEAQLKRAAREGRTPKGYITRPFVSPNPDTPMAIHVTKVSGSGEAGDEYDCQARVRIAHRQDPVTGEATPFAVAKPPEGQTEFADSTARERAIWIANHCNVLLHEAQNKDIGLWIRSVFSGVGAAQALGGGNNYWVPAVLCDDLHALMVELATRFGVHYERDPKTTLGPAHTKALFAQAAERSLSDGVAEMRILQLRHRGEVARPDLVHACHARQSLVPQIQFQGSRGALAPCPRDARHTHGGRCVNQERGHRRDKCPLR